MFNKKKCSGCAKKIDKGFSYCPHCGTSFRSQSEEEDFGILGRGDSAPMQASNEVKLPWGVEKIMGSLIKQLEKQMGGIGNVGNVPGGFKIRVSTGQPQAKQAIRRGPVEKEIVEKVSKEEAERRMMLPKVETESRVKRLDDKIIYEISTPGVHSKKNVVVTNLASGLEIKAYSKDKCYVKFIPLKVEVVEYSVEKEKVVVEIKG